MYGASSKLGRAGPAAGRGAGAKRINSMLPPQRPASGRLSLGSNSRGRGGGSSSAPAPAAEETFSLVAGKNPLAFAMIIRLAPDLVEEIRRLESAGGTARIKFDSVANNPTGNVIDVGGKEFKFTSSRETGDLCDIYEQRQSGEDGKGLLAETGCAWRKLNVQRILDESTKNHVKKLSEEAERKKDLRRAIVLDPGNPSMKSQIKQLAAVETNPWKHFKHKKEPPPKKRKIEPIQAGAPPKAAYKSGMSLSTTIKAKPSVSPISSPPEQAGHTASPLRTINTLKSHVGVEEIITPNEVIGKDKAAIGFDKEIASKATSVSRDVTGHKKNVGAVPMDLQSMLINLLKENPKGMSLKALEKAVGDSIPNSVRQIEPILKRIATFQAPGRYLLKPEAESEGAKKPSPESGSSPEENLHRTPAAEENRDQLHAMESDFKESVPLHEFDEKELLNTNLGDECNALKKNDIQQHSPDPFGERKVSDNSEGHARSSSDSGSDSDSDSDSSDSGSDSGSRSRSKSPVGSGSGSSSDSDSDASSNSKEGSDEDVDIMSDDDKEQKHKLQSDPVFSRSPAHWRSPDGSRPVQAGNECEIVEIEKDVPEGVAGMSIAGIPVPDDERDKPAGKTNSSSSDRDELQERQNFIGSLFDEGDNTVMDGPRYEQPESTERILKGKYKRAVEAKPSSDKSDKVKRSKTEMSHQPPVSGRRDVLFQDTSRRLPSDRLTEDPYNASGVQTTNGSDREGNSELFTLPKGNSQALPGKSNADFQQSVRRSTEQSALPKASDIAERPDNNYPEKVGSGHKYSDKKSHVYEGFPSQKGKSHKDAPYEDGHANEKKAPRNTKEGSAKPKQSTPSGLHHKKHGEAVGKSKDYGPVSVTFPSTSVKEGTKTGGDKSPAINGRGGNKLQREFSDLELGELREPLLPEETPAKKRFERKAPESNKPGPSDNWIADMMSKGKPGGKLPGLDLNAKDPINLEGSDNKKKNNEDRNEDLSRSQLRLAQHQQRIVDNSELGPQSNKSAETNGNSRQNEASVRQVNALEGYGESNKKAQAHQKHDSKPEIVPHTTRERKRGASNTLAELPDGRTEPILAECNNSERKRRDSSSDENSCSYSKYEKDKPDLKGPIKDSSQYKEYVQEYRDKYDSYCSLNKILESYRSEFHKLGKDLELTRGRDTESYYNVLEQLKESYRQCGTRHKRLKKIFVVLHEELKHLKQRIKDYALSFSKD